MNAFHAWLHPVATGVFPLLLWVTAAGTLACIAALIARRAGWTRLSAASRYLLLALALLLSPLAGLATLLPLKQTAPQAPAAVGTIVVPAAPVAVTPPQSSRRESPCVLTSAWAAGALLLISTELLRLPRRRRSSGAGHELLHELRSRLPAIPHEVIVADGCSDAFVEGLLRPRIVIPAEFAARLTDTELAAVLAHESSHISRHDNLVALCLRTATALFWFDPTRWVVLRAAMDERERACDEHVIDRGHSAETYIQAVLKSCGGAEPAVAACISSSKIGERMDAIMNYTSRKFVSHRVARFAMISGLVAACTAFSLAAPEPVIAATPAQQTPTPSVTATSHVQEDGLIVISVQIRDHRGKLVSAPRIIARADEEASVVSTVQDAELGELSYSVQTRANASGEGYVLFESRAEGTVLHSATVPLTSTGITRQSDRPKMDLSTRNADLQDVLAQFRVITGVTIDAADSLQGSVTIDVDDAPWDEVLAVVLAMNGYAYEWAGDSRIIVRRRQPDDPAGVPLSTGVWRSEPRKPRPAPEGYLTMEDGITPPRVISRVPPVYPPDALAARVQGVVILHALIDEAGVVQGAEIIKGLPLGLDDAAVESLRQWRFEPATKDGVPVSSVFNVTINFQLGSKEQ